MQDQQGPDGRSAAEAIKNKAAAAVHDVGDAAREKYEDIRNRASEFFEQGREKAQEWEEGAESYIRAKPMQALLIAAGVGVLLGLLMRRR
jgi:ElaB/YqjD/DUF883 family membrane-anchored ribosome-binding protein